MLKCYMCSAILNLHLHTLFMGRAGSERKSIYSSVYLLPVSNRRLEDWYELIFPHAMEHLVWKTSPIFWAQFQL